MAGFFCLSGSELETPPTTSNKQQEAGGGSENHYHHHHHHQRNQGNNNSLFLFRNEEIYNNNNNKGFEIWPQYHQNQQQNLNNYYSFGVVPSNRSTSRISINNDNDDVSGESGTRLDFTMMRQGSLGSGGGGGMNCQDCGNQAKKDCAHLRCRTCCKSRGFPCPTHVKSTWVPAARRRERQQQLTALQQQQLQIQEQQQQQQQNQQFRVEHTKRQRDRQASTSLRIPTNTSGLEIGDAFPPELNSPALFRCIKMNSIEESSEQYAYQTAVNIGGHVFKGVLYDQGPDSNYTSTSGGGGGGGEGCSDRVDQHLNLTTATTTTGTGNPSASILDPSSLYPTSFNAFMSGTHFFPSPRS